MKNAINMMFLAIFGCLTIATFIALLMAYSDGCIEREQFILPLVLICAVGFQSAYYEYNKKARVRR